MLGSKKRDYVTGNRIVMRRLKKHNELMNKYIVEGLTKAGASKRAYNEVIKMKFTGKK